MEVSRILGQVRTGYFLPPYFDGLQLRKVSVSYLDPAWGKISSYLIRQSVEGSFDHRSLVITGLD